jgi:hypothetical protein
MSKPVQFTDNRSIQAADRALERERPITDASKIYYRVKCDQCLAVSINGHACHETGCPKSKWPWHYDAELETCEPIHPSNLDGGGSLDNDYQEEEIE